MALTQVKTSGIADDAVTLAKQATGTDGNIISYDASGNPVAIATGNDGQVLTSTGAGSPPAFEAILANDVNNRVVTGTGSGLNGEENLTYDGNYLTQTIDSSGKGVIITAAGNHYPVFAGDSNRSSAGTYCTSFSGKWDGTTIGSFNVVTGADNTNKDDGKLEFSTASSGTETVHMTIASDGKVLIGTTDAGFSGTYTTVTIGNTTDTNTGLTIAAATNGYSRLHFADGNSGTAIYAGYICYDHNNDEFQVGANNVGTNKWEFKSDGNFKITDGDLVIGGTGHGINFSNSQTPASGTGITSVSETLDHYEEGTWTPVVNSGTISGGGYYTRIGNVVTVQMYDTVLGGTRTSAVLEISGLPFIPAKWTPGPMYAADYTAEGSEQASIAAQEGYANLKVVEWGNEAIGTDFGNGYFVGQCTYRIA